MSERVNAIHSGVASNASSFGQRSRRETIGCAGADGVAARATSYEGELMNVRKVIPLIVIAAVAAIPVAAALATPGSGFQPGTGVVARGTLDGQFKLKLRDSSKPGDVVVQRFILGAGGQSGWHFHPGPAVVTVLSGALTLDQDDCSSTIYTAGKVAIEPTDVVHRVRNLGTTNVEFWVTFLDIPVGSAHRIEPELDPRWVAPAC
jgi:quercetin dioxygenase-like cupin family protein